MSTTSRARSRTPRRATTRPAARTRHATRVFTITTASRGDGLAEREPRAGARSGKARYDGGFVLRGTRAWRARCAREMDDERDIACAAFVCVRALERDRA
jgi:hypothetical protein